MPAEFASLIIVAKSVVQPGRTDGAGTGRAGHGEAIRQHQTAQRRGHRHERHIKVAIHHAVQRDGALRHQIIKKTVIIEAWGAYD